MNLRRSTPAFASAILLLGCSAAGVNTSGKAFDTEWQNDSGASIAQLEQRLHALPRVANARIAVGVSDSGLSASSLDGKSRWKYAGHPSSAPIVAGPLVIFSEGDQIVALDARSGEKAWSIASGGLALRGAANDGTNSALVLDDSHKSLFLGVSASGSRLGSVESKADLGVPAARGGIAFVPWSSQYVSALDIESGNERARLLARSQVSQALNFGGDLYFGEQGLLRFDEKSRFASTNQANYIGLPKVELPGKPAWLGSGLVNPSSQANARAKIRIFAAPVADPNGELSLGAGTFAATYFRVVLGLDAKSGALRWVRALPADIVGGAAASSGFVLCDESGKVWSLDRAGADTGSLDLGAKVQLCTVDTGAEEVPAAPARASLAVQIAEALDRLDPNMAEAERYLVKELGKQTEPIVTKSLIDLSSSPRISPDLRLETRRLLALRRNGTDYMLSALARHYDFVSGVLLPPPVGPLADALAASGETRAAPLLAKHLNDPANSVDDIAHAARALAKLATPAEYEELKTFFALYRATADDEALVAAVVSCAEALVRVGGADGRALVEHAAQDPWTQTDVRRALPGILAKPPAPAAARAAAH